MLENKADEHMIEAAGPVRQLVDVALPEAHIGQLRVHGHPPGRIEGRFRYVHAVETGTGAGPGQGDGLGTDAATGLQHPAAGRVGSITMQQFGQRAGLVGQPAGFFF
jgi:hypothetical protein